VKYLLIIPILFFAALLKAQDNCYLTISNALQWRLQYSRVIEQAGKVEGVLRLE